MGTGVGVMPGGGVVIAPEAGLRSSVGPTSAGALLIGGDVGTVELVGLPAVALWAQTTNGRAMVAARRGRTFMVQGFLAGRRFRFVWAMSRSWSSLMESTI